MVEHEPHHCSVPPGNVHTTVTRFNSPVQYQFAMVIYAETRRLRNDLKIVTVSGVFSSSTFTDSPFLMVLSTVAKAGSVGVRYLCSVR